MNEEEKYLHLQMLVEQMPRLVEAGRPNNLPRKTHQWLGRLEAVIESSENKQVIAALEKSIRGLMGSLESSRREAAAWRLVEYKRAAHRLPSVFARHQRQVQQITTAEHTAHGQS